MTGRSRRRDRALRLFGALLFVCLAALLDAASAAHTALGCYRDVVDVKERVLPNFLLIDASAAAMTADLCVALCECRGFPVAGTQFGSECWCGWHAPPPLLVLPAGKCNTPCAGNSWTKCGGPLALSVYQCRADAVPPPPGSLTSAAAYATARAAVLPSAASFALPATQKRCGGAAAASALSAIARRPLLALVMIVKDEAHTLANTLRNVKPVIDAWYILDTGSTDGTQQLIRNEFASAAAVPGQLWEEPFVDYGTTRNRIMDLANATTAAAGRPVFVLMLSADETLADPVWLRTFLEANRYSDGPQHEAYPVVMNAGIDFDSVRIARLDANWRYVGKVHEFMGAADDKWHDLYRPLPRAVRVDFRATDTDRRYRSQYLIQRTLEKEIALRPNHTRSLFYLARTYTVVANWTFAYRTYEQLARVSGWDEERYDALLNLAVTAQSLAQPFHQIVALYLNAFEALPLRADALHALAELYRARGQHHNCALYARAAHQLPVPKTITTIQNVLLRRTQDLYDWQASRLFAICVSRALPPAPPTPPEFIAAPARIGAEPDSPAAAAGGGGATATKPKAVSSAPTVRLEVLARRRVQYATWRAEYDECVSAADHVFRYRASTPLLVPGNPQAPPRPHPPDHELTAIQRKCSDERLKLDALIAGTDALIAAAPPLALPAPAVAVKSASPLLFFGGSGSGRGRSMARGEAILAFVFVLFCCVLGVWFCRRRRSANRRPTGAAPRSPV